MLGKQPPEFSNFERVESRAGPFLQSPICERHTQRLPESFRGDAGLNDSNPFGMQSVIPLQTVGSQGRCRQPVAAKGDIARSEAGEVETATKGGKRRCP